MKNSKSVIKLFVAVLVCLLPHTIWAQTADTLRINGILKIAKGQELKINAGTQVLFSPGASVWVEGGLSITGEAQNPVVFSSVDPSNPGAGFLINGSDPNSIISIQHATFNHLARAISFEPFWNRKSVSLSNLVVKNSEFNEAIIYVASPLINLSKQSVDFELKNAHFFQNKAGVIIDNAGMSGITYYLDNLIFQNNTIEGNDNSLGILNINIASPYLAKNLLIGDIAFIQNTAGNKTLGLSLGGNQETIVAKGIYSLEGTRTVFDNQQDARLPVLEAPIKDANSYPLALCYFESVNHTANYILVKGKKCCTIKQVLDSNLLALPATINVYADSIAIPYTNGHAAYLLLENGMQITLPTLPIADTALATPIIKQPLVLQDTLVNPTKPWTKTYEVGFMAGLAFYVGDIKHRFGIPGVFDWSKTAFVQYNKSAKVSYRFGFSRTNIGMHNPTAPLAIWRSADTYGLKDGNYFLIPSFNNNFKTEIYTLDADFIYHLGSNQGKKVNPTEGKKGQWLPSIGTGVSLCYFEPYRMVVYSRNKDSAEFMKLRPLGLEGQNFLSNKRDYIPITLNVNLSFQLAYAYKNWRLRYEVKAIMSFSDYLDDFGQGYAYGNNYDKWKENLGDIDLPINKHTGKQVTIEEAFPRYETDLKRTTNMLPDMFFPQHIGVSYVLGRKK
jgi:hypothetical protein